MAVIASKKVMVVVSEKVVVSEVEVVSEVVEEAVCVCISCIGTYCFPQLSFANDTCFRCPQQ